MKTCKCGAQHTTSSSRCPPCHNAYQKAYYKKNPDSIRNSSNQRKKRNRELIQQLKSVPCKDCNETYPWYVMDFDHLRDKKFDVSRMSNYSVEQIMEEVGKCEVVCANCHRERTFSRK